MGEEITHSSFTSYLVFLFVCICKNFGFGPQLLLGISVTLQTKVYIRSIVDKAYSFYLFSDISSHTSISSTNQR